MINFSAYSFPKASGVYFFKDECNEILYIGKAKNLHKRIISYYTNRQIDWKLEALLRKSDCIEWIVTDTENAALLLEAELISMHRPLFNKLLISNNPFNYIVFKKNKNDMPSVEVTRFHNLNHDLIIGPFLRRTEILDFYNYIVVFFNLFVCKKKIDSGCLHFHIGLCCGSCLKNFNHKAYLKRYELAKIALSDEIKFIETIEAEIKRAKKVFDVDLLALLLKYKNQSKDFFHECKKRHNEEAINALLINTHLDKELNKKAHVEIQELMQLASIPKIIDCIDISHFQGHVVTGACVRFINGKYDKEYSKSYKLPYDQNNDYQNLTYLIAMHYVDQSVFPDLLLIDGGKGQLHTIEKLALSIPLMAIAKKEERIFTCFHHDGIVITPQTASGKLLINLRNATHTAAIRLHKKLFQKNVLIKL